MPTNINESETGMGGGEGGSGILRCEFEKFEFSRGGPEKLILNKHNLFSNHLDRDFRSLKLKGTYKMSL